MRQAASETTPLFDFYEISLDDLGNFPNAIQDIHCGRYHGVIIREAFDPATAAEVSRRVEQRETSMERISIESKLARYVKADGDGITAPPQENPAYVLGVARMAERDDDHYYAQAARFRAGCRALFEGLPDFEERMTTVLGALAGGRAVQVPPGPGDTTHTPATIRVLPRGLEVSLHVENFVPLSAARWLTTLAEMNQLSYFLTLQVPEGGGELMVYALEKNDVAELQARRGGGSPGTSIADDFARLLQDCDSMTFRPNAGDIIIFDGSRYYHRVTHVQGAVNRITMGGFLLTSRDDQTVYYWS